MALANKDHILPKHTSTMAIIQASSAFYDHQISPANSPEKPKIHLATSNSSTVSSPSSTNSNNGLGYHANAYNLPEEDHSVISFKPDFCNPYRSLLSFDVNPMWDEGLNNYHQNQSQDENPNGLTGIPYAASSSNGLQFDWVNEHEENMVNDVCHDGGNSKRPSTGESSQAMKKQCVAGCKKPKAKSISPTKDTQSLAAKNRRERISERLKILQDLVPNGSKVDLVTMLEKAISYVKFLQLQVKVLATDEFWPAQGGKAPDLSQVREAIDAILASQRSDRNSNSS